MQLLIPYTPHSGRPTGQWPSSKKFDALGHVSIEFTSDCNLRCVYCAVSSKTYHGITMPDWLVETLKRQLLQSPVRHVGINGHGETTMIEGWYDACRPFLEMIPESHLISNFARIFTRDELEVLARVTTIIVSLDTVDQELLKEVRRKVDLRNIVLNIVAVRATAARLGLPIPKIQINAGIYDRNIFGLPDLAHFCVAMNVHCLAFWSLLIHDVFVDDAKCETVASLPDEDLARGVEAIDEAQRIVEKAGIICRIPGGFVESIREMSRERARAAKQVAHA